MEKVYIFGKMEEGMKEIILMIKKMDLEYIFGQMVEDMKDNGEMVNSNKYVINKLFYDLIN